MPRTDQDRAVEAVRVAITDCWATWGVIPKDWVIRLAKVAVGAAQPHLHGTVNPEMTPEPSRRAKRMMTAEATSMATREALQLADYLAACLPDPAKLMVVAAWIDLQDSLHRVPEENREVQRDLRQWAVNAAEGLARWQRLHRG